jgi:hypothetical protein
MPFPLDPAFVKRAEEKLGRALPPGYATALLRSNGGEVEAVGEVWFLYPIFDDSDRKRLARTCNDIVRESATARSWTGFPREAVAIAHNGSGDHLVLLPSSSDPTRFDDAVLAWWHETSELVLVVDDFRLLERLG